MPKGIPKVTPTRKIVKCRKCGKRFDLKKKEMYWHCGSSVIILDEWTPFKLTRLDN